MVSSRRPVSSLFFVMLRFLSSCSPVLESSMNTSALPLRMSLSNLTSDRLKLVKVTTVAEKMQENQKSETVSYKLKLSGIYIYSEAFQLLCSDEWAFPVFSSSIRNRRKKQFRFFAFLFLFLFLPFFQQSNRVLGFSPLTPRNIVCLLEMKLLPDYYCVLHSERNKYLISTRTL